MIDKEEIELKDDIFSFKQKSQDFIVEEQLPFKLDGKGDALFVFFEKRNLNTMDVINHLTQKLKISRMTLGIAGLKDKKAITRQRVSIYKSALKKMGGPQVFINTLNEVGRVLKTNRHRQPIGLTTRINNIFYIRLRALKQLSMKEKEDVQASLQGLFDKGFLNQYWDQRFGIDERNWAQGKALLHGEESDVKKKEDIVFKVQAYASKLFNEYAEWRTKHGLDIMDGDILEVLDPSMWVMSSLWLYKKKTNTVRLFEDRKGDVDFMRNPYFFGIEIPYNAKLTRLTGPVLGQDMLIGDKQTEAGAKEHYVLEKAKIWKNEKEFLKTNRIYGLRRALWVMPLNVQMKFQGDDLLISFALPSGTYASVLIDKMMAEIRKH